MLTFLIFFIAGKTSYLIVITEIVPFLVYMGNWENRTSVCKTQK